MVNLTELPDLSKARNLECLCLCDCESLVELPSSLGHLDKLVKLSMLNCKKLKSLPCDIKLKSLKTLSLDGCINIEEFPFVSDVIEELGLRCTSVELVPNSISRLSKLTELRLSHCKRLKNLPDTFGNLTSLKHLTLTCCPNITVFPMLGNGVETVSLNGTLIEEVPSWIGISITEIPQVAGEMRRLDLHGTSIEKYGVLSEEEALVLHNRDMEFLKGFLTRYVRMYKRNRNSR
ncbi:hypothetical protein Bca52824_076826 [Brassica carinata]|uniref:R13L1/DRL21-like LRR repeat region domain-containing protein n=1 Tax=Brassica carinata TaxID=52824 RepID=A0A8X7PVM5_BRACI|nr:hypothetical protein Bca52824_076826 [Brassica carinata]